MGNMKPPICVICYRRFNPDDGGGLIYFKQTKKGREFDRLVKEEWITGHPPDAEWFCGAHSEEAKKLMYLTISEAEKTLKKKFEVH